VNAVGDICVIENLHDVFVMFVPSER